MQKVILLSVLYFVSFFAVATPIEILSDGGFEATTTKNTEWPIPLVSIGQWSGDGFSIVSAESGVNPLSGSGMYKFLGNNLIGGNHDTYQIIDVSAWATEIDAGTATIDYSAYFNSAGMVSGLGLSFWSLPAFSGSLSGYTTKLFDNFGNATDADESTWEQVSYTSISLDVNTRFVAFGLHSLTKNSGAYVDNASLTLNVASTEPQTPVPAPGVLSLFGLGLLVSAKRKKRQA
ncbi:PEP-CTERM sorting domain-containing protein [Alteromonas lipolytica]|uniref:PEP-CTERM protein-sorting domain-containing protein n=1 Tax=Alteromonas lipolytica TaxID=1856405 RepID=A0A1E8F8Y7_9ALTE|nr:PEP-CTERM sorting domain-containing protein [Alteromonas lipolytica]OFI32375.1 hypothetical protein BFC17_07275 [Alteromonas lipolytica]GGF86551.1 hypothetical protein GCM10011338_43690 [Alteromonas lipolytica]